MEKNEQNQIPMGQYPPEGAPPNHNQSVGAYPTLQGQGGFVEQGSNLTQQGGHVAQGAAPAQQGGYVAEGAAPAQQGGYVAQGAYPCQNCGYVAQGAYPTQQGGYVAQGVYPTQQGGYVVQGAYPNTTASVPASQSIVKMEKSSVMTVCTGCNNFVRTSVTNNFNGSGVCWLLYSGCCSGFLYALFLCCIDAFYTFRHKCPNCGKVLAQFTPKLTCAGMAVVIFALLSHVIIIILLFIAGLGGFRARASGFY